jgi:hypothetical protein
MFFYQKKNTAVARIRISNQWKLTLTKQPYQKEKCSRAHGHGSRALTSVQMEYMMRRKKQRGQLSCNKAVDVSPPGVVAERL